MKNKLYNKLIAQRINCPSQHNYKDRDSIECRDMGECRRIKKIGS